MGQVVAILNERGHILYLNEFVKTGIIVTFEFAQTHRKCRLILKLNVVPLFNSGTIDQTTFGVVPEKFTFGQIHSK